MPYAVVRLSRKQLDELIRERLRPDAKANWTYDVVVRVDEKALLEKKPKLARMKGKPTKKRGTKLGKKIRLSRAVQPVAPA